MTGILLGYQLDKITFYPYGGITTFNLPLNIPLKKEFLILIMGPLMQIVGYLFLKNFFSNLRIYHYTLLFFNLLPIYPLDGGKIINICFSYFNNYLKSFYFTFLFSILFLILLFIYNLKYYNFNMLLMIIFLFFKLIDFYQKRYLYYNRFLLERYLYNLSFHRVRNVSDIKSFYRDCLHFVHFKDEKHILNDYFQKSFK